MISPSTRRRSKTSGASSLGKLNVERPQKNSSSFDSQSTITDSVANIGTSQNLAASASRSSSSTTATSTLTRSDEKSQAADKSSRAVSASQQPITKTKSKKLILFSRETQMAEFATKYNEENRLESEHFIINDMDLAIDNFLDKCGAILGDPSDEDYDGDNDDYAGMGGLELEDDGVPGGVYLDDDESYESDDSYAHRFNCCLHNVVVFASKRRYVGDEPEITRRRLTACGLFRILVLKNKRSTQTYAFLIRLPDKRSDPSSSSPHPKPNEVWLWWM
jgi:hypothetical protein